MRIRALSVVDGVVYHCVCTDPSDPTRPRLEVDARTLPGDLDSGPLLVTVADYAFMVGPDVARACLPRLRERIVDHLGSPHLAFPTWTLVAST